jgi:hypothetical protein
MANGEQRTANGERKLSGRACSPFFTFAYEPTSFAADVFRFLVPLLLVFR